MNEQIECLNELIIEIKLQREKLEKLIILFENKSNIVDLWTSQYISILETKQSLKLNFSYLPVQDKSSLEKSLGSEMVERYCNLLDESIKQLISRGEPLKFTEIQAVISKLDALIVEIIVLKKQIQKGKQEALFRVKEIIQRIGLPLWAGTSMIALDVPSKSWPSIIGGTYTLLRVLEEIS